MGSPFVTDTLDLYKLYNDSTLDNFSSSNYLVNLERGPRCFLK